jgi:hypothetical protein
MESDDEAYEDLGDDFDIMGMLNEGVAAVVPEGETPEEKDQEEAEHANKDVHIFKDKDLMTQEEIDLDEYRKAVVAMLPTNLGVKMDEKAPALIPATDVQKTLDAGFAAFLDGEYNEGQIGELEDEEFSD